jgi:CheY-like chemotaxis protein
VEDEPSLLKFGKLVLNKLGYQVLEAADPDTALQLAQAHPDEIDLLLTDVVMPQMTGWDLSDKIAAIHPDIARLFMSGYADSAAARFGTSSKEVFFVSKPFSSKELAAKVRAALDSRFKEPRREAPLG